MGDQSTLFCGNLSEQVTDELLYELFLQAGPISRVDIPKDKEGKSRSFAFINFKHDVSVPYAIQIMSGEQLFGRRLNVKARVAPAANAVTSSPDTPGPSSGQRSYYYNRDNEQQHGRDDAHRNGSDFRSNHSSGTHDSRRRSADSRSLHSGRQGSYHGSSSTPTTPHMMYAPPSYPPNLTLRHFGEHSPLAIFDPLLEDRLRAIRQVQQQSYRGHNQEHHYYSDNRRYN